MCPATLRRRPTHRSGRRAPACGLRARLNSNVRARKTSNRRPAPIRLFRQPTLRTASVRSPNNAASRRSPSQVIEGASRQRAAPCSQFGGTAAPKRRYSIATRPIASARSYRLTPVALQGFHFTAGAGRTQRATRSIHLHSPPFILAVGGFHSRYTCHCAHWCTSQHTCCFGFNATMSSQSCAHRCS